MARKGSRKLSKKSSRKGSRKSSRKGSRRSMKREEGEKEERGNVTFMHKLSTTDVKNGVATVFEEYIVEGDKGLMFKLYVKSEKSKVKIVGRKNEDGTFSVRTMDGDKTDEQTLSKDELMKMLAKDKNLKFVLDYVKSMKGGKRKASKKASKKRSKKSSRK